MFFVNGDRLIINTAHPVYERYNQLSKGITASKVGNAYISGFYRRYDTRSWMENITIRFSLWRLVDENIKAEERGVDIFNHFTVTLPHGKRISYALVPQKNRDCSDKYPCEWEAEKGGDFEDINDPRVVLIARAYRGVVAEVAKDFVIENELPVQDWYFLRDWNFWSTQNRNDLTEKALQVLKPNAIWP